jgi:hypothetical protein
MEITRTRDVFTFSELSPEAQEKATELLCAEAWECLDSADISDNLADRFAMWADENSLGAHSAKQLADKYRVRIYWSVSYSQSDDAQIDGVLSRDYHPNLAWPDGIHTIRVSTNTYSWSRATDVYEIDDDGTEGRHTHDPKLIEAANEFVMELCQRLYRAARTECEWATSKEYVLDAYANCYGLTRRFTADGNYAPTEFWTDDEVSA